MSWFVGWFIFTQYQLMYVIYSQIMFIYIYIYIYIYMYILCVLFVNK